MARISKHSLMYGVTGMFGKQIVYKKRRGETMWPRRRM